MRHAFFLATRSLWWNRGRSLTIVLSMAITIGLPVTVHMALRQFQQEISARASTTPLILGARGSRIDLALHALYFESAAPATITMADAKQLTDSSLGTAIPLHIRFRTQAQPGVNGVPIVGTSTEYFEFRNLVTAEGELPTLLGDCVVGSECASRLGLKVGDRLLSAPRNALNLAGDYPLQMNVTGILESSHSPDDSVVFTDVQTAWVIEGIGHGHQEVNAQTDPALLLSNDSKNQMTANMGVLPWLEINDENRDSFHFHGDSSAFPLTAILAVPASEKARVQILGRYSDSQTRVQCIKPPDVIAELLTMVFRVEQLVRVCSIAAAVVTILLLGLVLSLSLKLRAAEMQTMFRLGCSRLTIVLLQLAEICLLLLTATGTAFIAGTATVVFAADAIRRLLF